MKLFFTLLLLPIFSWAACPNFAGKFRWESEYGENFTDIKIHQKTCAEATMVYDSGFGFKVTHEHIFDGQRRLVEDNGDFQAYEVATIDDKEMLIEEERHRTDEEDGSKSVYYVRIRIFLNVDNNLVILRETMRSDRVVIDTNKTTYKRVARVNNTDFSGYWFGEGIVNSKLGVQKCSGLNFWLTHSETLLDFFEITYPCIAVKISVEYIVAGDEIFEGVKKIGWIKPNEFYIYSADPVAKTYHEIHGEIKKNDILTFSQDFVDKKRPEVEFHAKAHYSRF